MKYLLDTHTWIWWHVSPEKLSERIVRLIEEYDGYEELLLSAISIWEFFKLVERGRLTLAIDPFDWAEAALDLPKLKVIPLSLAIAYHSTRLPQPFHHDPADQIIAATARKENAVVLTRDRILLDYPYINSLWE